MKENTKSGLEALIRLSLELVNASQGAFLEADDDSKTLRFAAVAVKHGTAEMLRRVSERLVGESVAYGEGVTGRAAATRIPQFASRSAGADMSSVRGDGVPNAVMAIPVFDGDRLLGVMTAVCFDRDLAFSDDALRQYGLAATVAATLLS